MADCSELVLEVEMLVILVWLLFLLGLTTLPKWGKNPQKRKASLLIYSFLNLLIILAAWIMYPKVGMSSLISEHDFYKMGGALYAVFVGVTLMFAYQRKEQ